MSRIKKLLFKYTLRPILKVAAKISPRLSLWYSDYRNQLLFKKLKSYGQDCHFHGSITIAWPERLSIGNNVHINHNAYINAAGGVVIGDNTHISRNLTLYSYSHNYEGEALPCDDTAIEKPVTIGKNVWIGMDVKIIPGVSIGDGAVVGLGTVVSEDVPFCAVVGLPKHRIIKYRDKDHYADLEKKCFYGGVDGKLYKSEK